MHRILSGTIALVAAVVSAVLCGAQESPADVLARVPSSGYSNHPAVRLLAELSWDIQPGGVVNLRIHEIVWVRTPDGVSSATPVRIAYRQTLDEIRVLYARTILPTGENIDATAITHTRPEPEANVYTDEWSLMIGFPRVGAGCVVEYAVERTSQPRFQLFSCGVDLSDAMWTIEARFEFSDHTGIGLQYELWNAEYRDSIVVTRTDPWSVAVDVSDAWRWENCPCGSYSAYSGDPFLVVSQYPSWDVLAAELRDSLSGRSENTSSVAAKAQELLTGVTGEEASIQALYEFVRDQIRYLATSFRLQGWQATPGAETLRRGWGDCKGKSALFVALLAEAGIEAYPALVSTECDLADGVGDVAWNIDCIDHVVTAVCLADGGLRILDPTCWWCTPSHGMWVSNTTVWVLSDTSSDGFRGDLVAVPARTPREWMTETEYRIDLDLNGTTVVEGEFVARAAAGQVWQSYAAWPPAMTDNDVADLVRYQLVPDTRVQTYSATFLSRENPVAVAFQLRGPLFGQWTAEELAVSPLPAVELYSSDRLPEMAKIVASDEIECAMPIAPRDETWTTTVSLPEGVEVVSLPENQIVCTSVASYFATYEIADGKITVSRELIIGCDGVGPNEYGEFQEVIDALLADSLSRIVLQKTP